MYESFLLNSVSLKNVCFVESVVLNSYLLCKIGIFVDYIEELKCRTWHCSATKNIFSTWERDS